MKHAKQNINDLLQTCEMHKIIFTPQLTARSVRRNRHLTKLKIKIINRRDKQIHRTLNKIRLCTAHRSVPQCCTVNIAITQHRRSQAQVQTA